MFPGTDVCKVVFCVSVGDVRGVLGGVCFVFVFVFFSSVVCV